MVISSKKSKKSGRVLKERLEELEYEGPIINYGYSGYSNNDVINPPSALRNAVNKREALEILDDEDIPTLLTERPYSFPIVGRPDFHSMGRWFYICWNPRDVRIAMNHRRHPATHFMEYLTGFREFRVHIVNGESIKISEKIGGGNYHSGATYQYPNFEHMNPLRQLAKDAVEALELDFGAVDIIYKDKFYVLEVNSAPRLTDEYSDTLERYAQAFMRNYNE